MSCCDGWKYEAVGECPRVVKVATIPLLIARCADLPLVINIVEVVTC